MKRNRYSVDAKVAIASLAVLAMTGACGDGRETLAQPPAIFDVQPDSGVEACSRQCSLDGRAVIDSCTGEVFERCADELACGAAKCQEPCAAAKDDRSSNGCAFYLTSARFTGFRHQQCHAAFVVNSSNRPATLSLEWRGKVRDLSKSLFRVVPNSTKLELQRGPIAPGESAIVFLSQRDQTKQRTQAEMFEYIGCPKTVSAAIEEDFAIFGSTIGDALHLTSDVPVGLTSMYPYGGAESFIPSATLVFPVSAWAKEHLVVTGWEASQELPVAQIYASEDDTEVTLIGRKDVGNGAGFTGAAKGTPMTIRLDKGQFAQIVQGEDLTGSVVRSNKPTLTLGGNGCANLPVEAGPCDGLAQQIPPYEQWGSEYVGVSYRPRVPGADEVVWYRLLAARDGTELEYDGVKPAGAPLAMAAGELVIFRARSTAPFVVRSRDKERPVYMSIHMTGGGGNPPSIPSTGNMGDPDFVNVVPTGQYLNKYSFYADSTYQEHSLVIVRKKTHGAFRDVWLECAGNLPSFAPIDAAGQYEYTRVDLSRDFGPGDKFGDKQCITGLQRMRSEGAFTATLWGWGRNASYGYPGGVALRKLVDTPLDVK